MPAAAGVGGEGDLWCRSRAVPGVMGSTVLARPITAQAHAVDFTPLPTPPLIFDRTVFCEFPPYPTEQEALYPPLTYLRCLEMKMGALSGAQLDNVLWPADAFGSFALLLPVGLLGDACGLKVAVGAGLLCREATRVILLFGQGLAWMAAAQFTFAAASCANTKRLWRWLQSRILKSRESRTFYRPVLYRPA